MEHALRADAEGRPEPETAPDAVPNQGEVLFTAVAAIGFLCAVAAAAGAWMLMTDPDRLMWAATGDAGSMATFITRTAARLASAALALVGS